LNGLRFDIYERVHLSDDVAAIEELEEIELVPHMQAIPLEDQILLKGHLLLTGTYRSQDERSATRQLEHWIPVEISLPPSRIEKLEDLAIEIDNFDVDLLSTRSLNVTGVLGLKGLQVSSPPAPVWREDGFTVVHQLPQDAIAGGSSGEPARQEGASGWESASAASLRPESFRREEAAPSGNEAQSAAEQTANPSPPQAVPEKPAYENKYADYADDADAAQESGEYAMDADQSDFPTGEAPYESAPYAQPPDGLYQPPMREEQGQAPSAGEGWGDVSPGLSAAGKAVAPPPQEAVVQEAGAPEGAADEKPGMKIALGTKTPSESASVASGVGLLSHFGNKGAKADAEPAPAEDEANAYASADADSPGEGSGDEVEWTRLFLSKEEGEQSFRKVKLCIVQREDTLDAIATRYNVQPRELQLYNRLNDPNVSEGQVLYIPS